MAEDKEHLILETARRHFVQNGYAATRMQEIADDAGINKALLHYYYRSKEKLYDRILTETMDFMVPKIAGAMISEGTFFERLEKLIEQYISVLIEHPDIPFFILTEITQRKDKLVAEIRNRSHHFPAAQSFLMQMIKEMEEGKLKKMPPHQVFLNIMSMTVFPFVVRPVFTTVFQQDENDFKSMMEERKKFLLEFMKGALKPD
ncbi:MAG: helix-turn-helix domain-containing protein [Bacteroidota bacterium]